MSNKASCSRIQISIRIVCGIFALLCGWILWTIGSLSRQIPDQFSITEGMSLQLGEVIQVSFPSQQENLSKACSFTADTSYTVTLNLFGLIPIKDVSINVVEEPVVVLCGTPFGIKMFSEEAVIRNDETLKTDTYNHFKLQVQDNSINGLGTMTFYNPNNHTFGGLGHAFCEVGTGKTLTLSTGEIVPARIDGIKKAENGVPGKLYGGFEIGSLGTLAINGETGIYGTLNHSPGIIGSVPVCMKQQVKTGEAQILTTIHGNKPELYDIRIDKISYNDSSPTHNMIITVTDPRLLKETGGIVQGMSGSPILQDGKFVGAVSHVFINNPIKGYAIFAENMIKTASSITNIENAS